VRSPLLLLAACLALRTCVAEPVSAQTLSLKEAVRFALENSRTFDIARKAESVRDLEYKNAVAKLLPSADFLTTNGLQNNIPIASANGSTSLLTANPSAPWYSSLTVGMTETLYDNGVSLTGLSVARLNRELSSVNSLKARDGLALDVATEFYKFSLATVLLEVRKQQQGALEKQFRSLSGQYKQGFKTRSDFLRLKTQVQRAEIDRITAENNIVLSTAQLRKILGIGAQRSDELSFEPIPVAGNKSKALSFPGKRPPLEGVFDYKTTQIQKEINGASVTLARRNYWPQVLFNSGVTYSNQNYLNGETPFAAGHQLSWNALVTLQLNLFDWGTRRRSVEIAEFNENIQDDTLEQNLLDVNAQITALMADLSRIDHNFKLSRELLDMEEESSRNLETQYREGKVTYLDLITSLSSLLDAKVQFCTSYFDGLGSIARYKFYEGTLYETLVQ
jgi:outer membrane protein TolC